MQLLSGAVTLVDEVEDITDMQPSVKPKATSNVRKKAFLTLAVGAVVAFIWWKKRRYCWQIRKLLLFGVSR